MNIKDLVRPEILDLPIISPPTASNNMIRMNANESPESPWSNNQFIPLNRYPPVRPNSLMKKIAQFYNIKNDEILLSRGSTEAIDIIIRTFCVPNEDKILISPPTFDMYQFFAKANSISTIEVPLSEKNNFTLNIENLIKKITEETKIIFLSSPNNPCGSSIKSEEIKILLKAVKGKVIVVVDEAYIEFSSTKSMINEINNYNNLIVLRTLSKAFALAGARCGSMISSKEGIQFLKKIQPPFCFSTPIINHIEAVLSSDGINSANSEIANIITERKLLKNRMQTLDCVDKVWVSDGNFLLTRFKNIDRVKKHLDKENIVIGILKDDLLKNCARITIGTKDENSSLINSLHKLN